MGPLLVLLSWSVALVLLVILGLPIALLAGRTINAATLRLSIWVGLLVAMVIVLAVNIVMPLRSAGAALIVGCAVLGALATIVVRRPSIRGLRRSPWARFQLAHPAVKLLIGTLLVTIVYLAVAALGPVTNYDSGLYHLGAIKYAADYATIPGLGNLYQAFGYNNSMFPFAAFLGNGPWDGIGFRLANGLILTAMAAELVLRLSARRASVGTYVLVMSVVASWVPLVALSDYWVTSPTSDPAVMVFSLVSLAYLADALRSPANFSRSAAGAFVLALLAFSMRPTMAFFLATVIAVLATQAWINAGRRVKVPRVAPLVLAVGILGAMLLGIQTARDYLLTGWWQYPLSLWKFDVSWLALDPVNTRASTLGTARNPLNYLESAQGWSWVGPWFARLPQQWEFFEFSALVLFSVALGIVAHRVTGRRILSRGLLLLLLPSVVSALAWWVVTPPSFRFIWGPLFGLACAASGWFLFLIARARRPLRAPDALSLLGAGAAIALISVVSFSTVTRLDYGTMTEERSFSVGNIGIPYYVTPIPKSRTRDVPTSTNLTVRMPEETDQCWDSYPLCTPLVESAVSMRGRSIQEGFNP